jgi:SAM-dependent methyltransferase
LYNFWVPRPWRELRIASCCTLVHPGAKSIGKICRIRNASAYWIDRYHGCCNDARAAKGGVMSSSFTQIYEKDTWGSSGPGSDPTTTIGYRAFLQKFIAMNPIATITDIGCGDWQSSRLLNLTDISYVGYDVVPKVVERNKRLYGKKGVDFMAMPNDVGDIPGSDLLLMKDVLQHLSNAEIKNFSDNVFPKFKFCLITNSFGKINTNATEISWMKARQNVDIESGAFRCLDLLREPYNLKGVNIFEHFRPWEQSMTVLIIN